MPSDLDLIRRIQKLDIRIDELLQELSLLPKQVAEIEKKLESHEAELQAQKTALENNEKERRRLEVEAADLEQKAVRLEGQMSEAKTNEQYRAFRHEIAFARKSVKTSEDAVLDKMEEAESLREKITSAEQSLAAERESVAAEIEVTKGRFKGDEEELAAVNKDRAELAGQANARLLKVYDRVKLKLKHRAVSALEGQRCTSCNMLVRPQLLQQLNRGDDLVHCEFCGCILYVPEPESAGLEDPAGEAGIA